MTARNRFFLALLPALACSVALVAPDAPGQQPGGTPPRPPAGAAGQKARPAEATKFSGRVTETKRVTFGKSGDKHLIATVESKDGQTRVVDLGPADGKAAPAVARGDQITVSGQTRGVVKVQRTEILFASQLRTGDRTVTINRPAGGGRAQQSISGTVTRTKQVYWRGSDRRELIAQLKTTDGEQVVADLGPTMAMKDGKVKSGSSLTLRGRYATVGGQRVFFATEATCNDVNKTMTIRRDVSPFKGKPEQSGQQPAGAERSTITGSVRGTKEVGLKDGSGKNMLILVRAENGKYAVVDLGTVKTAQGYGFKNGDPFTATGRLYRINDRAVLVADQVEADGKSHRISRPQK